jgi:hypothetical protein
MPHSPLLATVNIMNASLLHAFELHKARYDDMLRQAEESRLTQRLAESAGHRTRVPGRGLRPPAAQQGGEAA